MFKGIAILNSSPRPLRPLQFNLCLFDVFSIFRFSVVKSESPNPPALIADTSMNPAN